MSSEAEDKDFYDDVLIKLKRKYGKDELVASLNKEISELKIELGKEKAYIQELEFEKENGIVHHNEKISKEAKLDELYQLQKQENKRLRTELQKAKTTNRELIHRLALLQK
jgi:predicted RNase H-like nuclease (RuvC/YqgF family)